MKKLLTLLYVLLLALSLMLALGSCAGDGDTDPDPDPDTDGDDEDFGKDMTDEEKLEVIDTLTLDNLTVVYDGTEQKIKVDGRLPAGVTVSYEGGGTDVGKYTVVAKFYLDGKYLEDRDLSAALTVTKRTADLSKLSFQSVTKTYTGKDIAITLTGELPEWLTVTYENNVGRLPGSYDARAIFSVADAKNNLAPEPMRAVLNIVIGDYITPGLTLAKKSDGTAEVTGYTGTESYVIIPEAYEGATVTSIKNAAFAGNTAVKTVRLSYGVKSIGAAAFKDCSKLDTVEFGTGLRTIGGLAFANTAITKITVPDGVTVIGNGAFEGTEMTEITLPFIGGSKDSSSPYIGYIFGATDYAGNAQHIPATLSTVRLSDKCTRIPAFSFYGMTSLKNIYIGNSVTVIENAAFSWCSGLESVYIPGGVTSIPANQFGHNSPFYGCSKSLKLVLGGKVPSGFGAQWKVVSTSACATVVESVSFEKYLETYK